jgi:hypothetical protein
VGSRNLTVACELARARFLRKMLGSCATFGMSGLLAVFPTHFVVMAMPKDAEAEPTSIEQQCFQKDVIVNNILQFVGAGQ